MSIDKALTIPLAHRALRAGAFLIGAAPTLAPDPLDVEATRMWSEFAMDAEAFPDFCEHLAKLDQQLTAQIAAWEAQIERDNRFTRFIP